MEQILIPIFVILLGSANLYYGIKVIRDIDFAKAYMLHSPKGWLWRKLFGIDTATKIARYVFAPLAILLGSSITMFGIYLFF
jgi:hypothetical protein